MGSPASVGGGATDQGTYVRFSRDRSDVRESMCEETENALVVCGGWGANGAWRLALGLLGQTCAKPSNRQQGRKAEARESSDRARGSGLRAPRLSCEVIGVRSITSIGVSWDETVAAN